MNSAGSLALCPSPRPQRHWQQTGAHLELAQGVVAIEVFTFAVHLQGVVLRPLHGLVAEHRGLFPDGIAHQGDGELPGRDLEGEALLQAQQHSEV